MIESICKPKLPKDYGYVLRTSQLQKLLDENDMDIHIDLNYWLPQITGSFFEVHFWLPNANVSYRRLYIRAGAVLRADVKGARDALEATVFPEFTSWYRQLAKLPDNSPRLEHNLCFSAKYIEGTVRCSCYKG